MKKVYTVHRINVINVVSYVRNILSIRICRLWTGHVAALGGMRKCLQNFIRKTLREENRLRERAGDGRIVLKSILDK